MNWSDAHNDTFYHWGSSLDKAGVDREHKDSPDIRSLVDHRLLGLATALGCNRTRMIFARYLYLTGHIRG